MKTSVILATVAAVVGSGVGAAAVAGTYEAWGHTFTYDTFQPQMMDVTVATERGTGHKMNIVKMHNGHMMALVPADRYIGLMTIPDDDMVK